MLQSADSMHYQDSQIKIRVHGLIMGVIMSFIILCLENVLQTDRLVIQSELLQTHRLLLMQLCLT